MSFLQSLILGIVQGLTEFLPVSSSAHLTLVSAWLGVKESIPFFVFLHLATMLAALIYFRRDIFLILESLGKIFSGRRFWPLYKEDAYFKLFCLVILGSGATAAIGFLFKDFFKASFGSLFMIGFFLIITGIFLWLADFLEAGDRDIFQTGFWPALLVGLAQGLAIAPGISRSGATVVAALFTKMKKNLAVKFSFLLSIPAILGASLFELKDILKTSAKINIFSGPFWLGFLAAFFSGYLAIFIFIRLIVKQKLKLFAVYCFILGLVLMVFL